MEQKFLVNKKTALRWAEIGNLNTQRTAYWFDENKQQFFRAERLPGETRPSIKENVGGHWWNDSTTIKDYYEKKMKNRTIFAAITNGDEIELVEMTLQEFYEKFDGGDRMYWNSRDDALETLADLYTILCEHE